MTFCGFFLRRMEALPAKEAKTVDKLLAELNILRKAWFGLDYVLHPRRAPVYHSAWPRLKQQVARLQWVQGRFFCGQGRRHRREGPGCPRKGESLCSSMRPVLNRTLKPASGRRWK
jgi:hypothetical protein